MAFESEFADMLNKTVVYEPLLSSSSSGSGDRLYDGARAQTVACRIQSRTEMARNSKGLEVVSKTQLFCAPVDVTGAPFSPDGNLTGRFTLPDGSRPPLISIDAEDDTDGVHHVKVFL